MRPSNEIPVCFVVTGVQVGGSIEEPATPLNIAQLGMSAGQRQFGHIVGLILRNISGDCTISSITTLPDRYQRQ